MKHFHTHREGQAYSILQARENKIEAGIHVSIGIHPWEVALNWEIAFEKIKEEAAQNPQVLAIGEAGFDRLKGPEILLQKAAFYAQASLATQLEIPLILHCVKSHDLLLYFFLWKATNSSAKQCRTMVERKVCPIGSIFFETDDSGLIYQSTSLILQLHNI
jgi:TatD DNase family protein